MKFTGKVIGTNNIFKSLDGSETNVELKFKKNKDYELTLGENSYYYEIYNFIFNEDSIDLEGWAGSKDNNFARLAIRVKPLS